MTYSAKPIKKSKGIAPKRFAGRTALPLAIAMIVFTLGAGVIAVWLTRRVPKLEGPVSSMDRCFPGLAQKVEILKPADAGYFPRGAFFEDERRDRFIVEWYSRYLSQMNEPSLLASNTDKSDIYRFLWLRSFHSTIVVRLFRNGNARMLSVKELTRAPEKQLGQVRVNRTRVVTDEEWAKFGTLLNDSCFWSLPTTSNEPLSTDAAWWAFEGSHQGYYHIVNRQSPQNGPYRELCFYLLKLSDLPLDASKGEIY